MARRKEPLPEVLEIGARIREVLTERNMMKKELAEKSGVSETAIWTICAGRMKPRVMTIRLIADALDVSETWLITGREDS